MTDHDQRGDRRSSVSYGLELHTRGEAESIDNMMSGCVKTGMAECSIWRPNDGVMVSYTFISNSLGVATPLAGADNKFRST